MIIKTLIATGFITTVLHHPLNQKRQLSFFVIAWFKKVNGFYHTNTIDPAKHLNESQIHLNK